MLVNPISVKGTGLILPALIAQAALILPKKDLAGSRGKVSKTEFKCLVCSKPLEEYHYVKEGQKKTRQGNWWSKDFDFKRKIIWRSLLRKMRII